MNPWMALLAALAGYLLGGISFARIMMHVFRPQKSADDIPEVIDLAGGTYRGPLRRMSAGKVRAELGDKLGCLTSILDMLKVALPALALRLAFPGSGYFLILAAAAVIGHNWPIYYRFRGGYGFSPIMGGTTVVDPLSLPVMFIIPAIIGALFRTPYGGNMLACAALVPWMWFRFHDPLHVAYALVVAACYIGEILPDMLKRRRMLRDEPDKLIMQQPAPWAGMAAKIGKGKLPQGPQAG
jgi:glycerol-3-phosphate acyltransferase PlsY